MAEPDSTERLEIASQAFTTLTISPIIAGLSLQIFVTGLCIRPALNHIFPELVSRFSGTTSNFSRSIASRTVCAAISVLNILLFIAAWYQIIHWSTLQLQSQQDAWNFTWVDSLVPSFGGALAVLVQASFAYRAWLLLKRSLVFLLIISALILVDIGAALGSTIVSFIPQTASDSEEVWDLLYIFTLLWSVATAVTDLAIAGTLMVTLTRSRTWKNVRNKSLTIQIVSLAFESAALPATFALASVVVFVITRNYNSANIVYALQYPLPAIYTLSYLWCLDGLAGVRARQLVAESSDPHGQRVCEQCGRQAPKQWRGSPNEKELTEHEFDALDFSTSRTGDPRGSERHNAISILNDPSHYLVPASSPNSHKRSPSECSN